MKKLILLVTLLLPFCLLFAQPKTVIGKGHSHNDYEQAKPFWEAANLGYRSIEADIWLYNGELVVSHDKKDLAHKKTLKEMYLEPLKQIFMHPIPYLLDVQHPLVLMIDIKSDGEETYKVLEQQLKQYNPILTKYVKMDTQKNYVSVLISGNKPYKAVANETERFVTLDCDIKYGNDRPDFPYITRLSDNYSEHFKWDGKGTMPDDEHEELLKLVKQVHGQHRDIRFWGAPDTPDLWKTFLDAGVDWINTDKLQEFADFYAQYKQQHK